MFFKFFFVRYLGVSSSNINDLYVKDFFGFNFFVFFGVLVVVIVLGVLIYRLFKLKRYVFVYMLCENLDNFVFRGEKDKVVLFEFKNYYFEILINEKIVMFVVNVFLIVLIVIMFGVILK